MFNGWFVDDIKISTVIVIVKCFKISRLWGDHGQLALETAHVCLINATALGTEILKSLVLPGVNSFTIVDGSKIREEDVSTK